MENHKMKTLSECMTSLKKHGFEHDFFVTEEGYIKSYVSEQTWSAGDVKIENFYRFEGQSDPGDSSILYALETNDGVKGMISHPYGADSDGKVEDFIKKIEDISKKDSRHTKES
jgi:hypothetical protein